MPDTRVYYASGAVQLAKDSNGAHESSVLADTNLPAATEKPLEQQYQAISPSGSKLNIPKELFIALSDFIKTRT
jgi:hypothetical protein